MTGSRSSSAPQLAFALLTKVAKRVGLSKAIVRLMTRQMRSKDLKARAFAGYRPTKHDVFVATYGKSGTNWMMQIAQQIAYRGRSEFEHIHDVVPWPDAPGPTARWIAPLSDSSGSPPPSPTGLRVIKTHLATEFVPYSADACYLTVLRDPKEVLVSSYYFLGGILGVLSHVSIDDWFELFIGSGSPSSGSPSSGSLASEWASHTASYWAWRERPNLLVLNYREIVEDPHGSIERVAATMGVELTQEELALVVERSSFEYMKAHQSQFAPPRLPLTKESERPLMIRRGKSGQSGEQLSAAQQSAVDRICQQELERLRSDFPYARFFDTSTRASTPGEPQSRR